MMTEEQEKNPAEKTLFSLTPELRKWWVIKCGRQFMKVKDVLTQEKNEHSDSFDFFLPTEFVIQKDKNGKKRRVEKTVIFNYAFVYCSFRNILQFTEDNKDIVSRMYRRKTETTQMTSKQMSDFQRERIDNTSQLLWVPDLQMKMFIQTVGSYEAGVPYLRPEEVDLTKGDRVRIIGGEFDGVEGILITQQGKDGGRVLVSISNVLCVPTLEIEPQFIEVLEFAKTGKHLYKKFESFILKIRPALKDTVSQQKEEINWKAVTRKASAEERLQGAGDKVIVGQARQFGERHPYYNDILIFVRRFSNFQPNTNNQLAKQLTFLLMAQKVLGDEAEVKRYIGLCNNLLPSIKATITRAFVLVYLYGCTGVQEYCDLAEAEMETWAKLGDSDKTRQMLREDLAYFCEVYR